MSMAYECHSKNKKITKWVWPMSAIVKNKNNKKKNEYGLWVPYQKKNI